MTTDWEAWSRAAWHRHAPRLDVAALGEATIHGLAHATAASNPSRQAVRIGAAVISHGGLDAQASRFAAWLTKRVAPGDRVILSAPVSPAWIACYLGALRAGAVAVLANPTYTEHELDALVEASTPALVLRDLDGVELPDAGEPAPASDPDATALLAFTSGTTGKPKGVPLTHRQLLTSIRSAMAAWRWTADDVLVHALPLYHQHGLGGVHATLIAGSTLHLLPHFEPPDFVAELESAEATVVFAVPVMYARLAGLAESRNRLRLCVSGSAPLGADVARQAAQVLGRAPLVRYGLTESGLDVSQLYAEPHVEGTVGIPLPGLQLRLAPDGEIQMRGPQVFGGYWNDEAATREAFTGDGWFRTGDVGALDEASGQLAITGRIKEMIITGGMKVMPREVEIALEQHPAVAEAAVGGVPSERWGEQVTAWVVMRAGVRFDAAALIAHVRSRLAPYKRPKEIIEVDRLPRNHMGKLDRRKLQASSAVDKRRADGSSAD